VWGAITPSKSSTQVKMARPLTLNTSAATRLAV
jgi:hypothetical protein